MTTNESLLLIAATAVATVAAFVTLTPAVAVDVVPSFEQVRSLDTAPLFADFDAKFVLAK